MLQRIYTYGRNRKTVLWAGAVAAAVIIVIILAVVLPQPGPDGTGPTATPTPTATPAGNATATANVTAPPDGTPEGTATSGRTSTPEGTTTTQPAHTPRPTADGGAARGIFFTETAYTATQDGDGCEKFLTTINITAPVGFLGACQLRLTWDSALFKLDDAWVNSNADAKGRVYNGSAWLTSAQPLSNPTGDSEFIQFRPVFTITPRTVHAAILHGLQNSFFREFFNEKSGRESTKLDSQSAIFMKIRC